MVEKVEQQIQKRKKAFEIIFSMFGNIKKCTYMSSLYIYNNIYTCTEIFIIYILCISKYTQQKPQEDMF